MSLRQIFAVGSIGFKQVRNGIESEPIKAKSKPMTDHLDHCVLNLGVAIVQIWLMVKEAMPVVLLPLMIEAPVRGLRIYKNDPSIAPPLIVISPYVPVRLGIRGVLSRFQEPRVLIRGVVHHHVCNHANPTAVRLFDQVGCIISGPKIWVHGQEVRDVIPAISQRGLIKGQQPQAVNAQPLQIIQLGS